MLRVDEDSQTQWTEVPIDVLKRLPEFDAVVISDYNKGAIKDQDARNIITASPCPVFVDTKRPNPEVFARCFAIFPNALEYEHLGPADTYQHVIRKGGELGSWVDGQHIPTTPIHAFDVTGAGDCYLAAFIAAHLKGLSLIDAARIANKAAGIAVQHIGSYVLTSEDSKQIWSSPSNPLRSRRSHTIPVLKN